MSGEDHYHQPRQGHLSKDQSICYKNEDDYYLSIYRKNEDGDYLEFKDTLDDLDDIYHHDDRYCRLDIEAKPLPSNQSGSSDKRHVRLSSSAFCDQVICDGEEKSLIKMVLAITNPGQDYIQRPGR